MLVYKIKIEIREKYYLLLAVIVINLFCNLISNAQAPVSANGRLSVSGKYLVNKKGDTIQLRGMSSHGPGWFQSCYNETSLDVLVNDWGIDVFRIAMYTEPMYIEAPDKWKSWIDNMVDMCQERGIYCLIDWHILSDGNPNKYINEAKDFFNHMSGKHGNKEHVLYEICNEPNGVSWDTIKIYANQIIPVIRANAPKSIIIVGTPNWSQHVDIVSLDILPYENIMYSLHFYAGSHEEVKIKLARALDNNLPVFVTEFGVSTYTGNGGPFITETKSWLDLLATHKISWCNWAFSAGDYTSDALYPGSCDEENYNNTKEGATFIKNAILIPEDCWQEKIDIYKID